jgi:tRNA pseudouridine55 synthase
LTIKKTYQFLEGETLLINKPLTWTSFDVVNKIRYLLKKKLQVKKLKVGHAGTLDPLATGLLLVNTGKATKQIDMLQGLPKEYTGTIYLGATTPSFDLETEINQRFDIAHITKEMILATAQSFIGETMQLPPVFSAKKVDGQIAYKKARVGESVELKHQKVFIEQFDIEKIDFPHIHFKIVCSKGTYIRSIANDFGKKLNNGAHLSELKRTKIGSYSIDNAIDISEFEKILLNQE